MNTVKTQIWIAISFYVLVAIIKKEPNLDRSLSEILQILSFTLFEKSSIYQVISGCYSEIKEQTSCNQLSLYDS